MKRRLVMNERAAYNSSSKQLPVYDSDDGNVEYPDYSYLNKDY